ncbi:hypothetical protein HanRHA438_Chr08g0337781 [Helianthus annuus]|nr:hypothetical protein HanRHA438_Chr08g0337781 [Helianthus annuus]
MLHQIEKYIYIFCFSGVCLINWDLSSCRVTFIPYVMSRTSKRHSRRRKHRFFHGLFKKRFFHCNCS